MDFETKMIDFGCFLDRFLYFYDKKNKKVEKWPSGALGVAARRHRGICSITNDYMLHVICYMLYAFWIVMIVF